MAAGTFLYTNGLLKIQNGVNLISDSLKFGLLTNSYAGQANLNIDTTYANVSTYEVTGAGYTAGGVAVAGATLTQVNGSSGTAWAASTPYTVGQIVAAQVSTVYYLFCCVAAGTSGASAPSWNTVSGEDTTDNTVNWCCIGTAMTSFTITAPSWSNSTITAAFGFLYDTTLSNYLIALCDFGGNITSTNGPFTYTPPAQGLFNAFRL